MISKKININYLGLLNFFKNYLKYTGVIIYTLLKAILTLLITKLIVAFGGMNSFVIVNQFQNISTILQQFASGGLYTAITKFTSEKGNIQNSREYIYSSLFIIFLLNLLILILHLFFFTEVFYFFKKNNVQNLTYFLFFLSIPIFSLNLFLVAIINGINPLSDLVSYNIVNSLIGILFSIILLKYYTLDNAIIVICYYQTILFFYLVYKNNFIIKIKFSELKELVNKYEIYKELIKYSLLVLVTSIAIPISQFIIRQYLTTNFSITHAALWDGLQKISFGLIGAINTVIGLIFVPIFSKTSSILELKKELGKAILFTIILCLIVLIPLFIFKNELIFALFNKEFIKMNKLFIFEFLGIFFRMIGWIICLFFLSKGIVIPIIISEIFFSIFLYISLHIIISNFLSYDLISVANALNYLVYLFYLIYKYKSYFSRNFSNEYSQRNS